MAKDREQTEIPLEHQFLHLLLVFLLLLQVEHRSENPVPDRAAYPETFVVVFIMMEMMVAPKGFHPSERRVPCMDRVMHRPVKQIPQHKSREEHENIGAKDQSHQQEN